MMAKDILKYTNLISLSLLDLQLFDLELSIYLFMKLENSFENLNLADLSRDVRGAKKIAPHRTATFVPSHRTAPHRTADIFKNRAPHRTALQEKIFKLLITKKKIF